MRMHVMQVFSKKWQHPFLPSMDSILALRTIGYLGLSYIGFKSYTTPSAVYLV